MKSAYIILQLIFLLIFTSANANLELSFNFERGYYSNGFQLIIACNEADAVIRYTTNLGKPGINRGNIYSTPLNINQSTILKVIAYNATDTSKMITQSYLLIEDIINCLLYTSPSPRDS